MYQRIASIDTLRVLMAEELKRIEKRIKDGGKKEVNPPNLRIEYLLIRGLKSLIKGLK